MKKATKISKDNTGRGSHQSSWQIGALSEKGPVREENQDRMCGLKVELGQVYVVADGMGGHKGGARAAQIVVDELGAALRRAGSGVHVPHAMQMAFERANRCVYQQAHSGDRATHGMGAAAVLLLIMENSAYVAHVGDSRAYLYRDGRLLRLTRDHTRVERMVAAGVLTPKEARDHPGASMLERAVGIKPEIDADISKSYKIKADDGFLLCSDGLSGFVSDTEILNLLKANPPVDQVPGRLCEIALKKGSNDNITIQYIKRGDGMRTQSKSRNAVKTAAVIAMIALPAALGVYRQFFGTEASLNSRLAQERQNYAKVQKELGILQGNKQQIEKQLNELFAQQSAINKKVASLKEKIVQVKNSIASAEEKKKNNETRMRNLEKEIERLNDRR